MAAETVRRMRSIHYAWVVVLAAFLAILLASGLRSSFGVYVKPFEAEFHESRATIALVASLSILINGVLQPIWGQLLDRFGARKIAVFCLIGAVIGTLATAVVTDFWQLYFTFGIAVSAAVGGPATVMASVVSARWFVKNRGLVMGILAAGTSSGQLVIIPLAMQLSLAYGWRMSYVLLALLLAAAVLPVGLLLRTDPSDMGMKPFGAGEENTTSNAGPGTDQAIKTPLGRAARTHGFWMLVLTFGICGYTTAGLISTHLVAYTVERGFDAMTAAAGMGLMGAVNVVGTIVSGIITDRMGRKNPLAAIYFVRGLALLFLLTVDTAFELNLYAVVFGMAYIATVPPTSALTAQLFGRLSVGVIFGVVFMSHQIGGALGSYVTGLLFDATESYFIGFLFGALLCFVAAAMAFSIREKPVRKPTPAVAAS